MFNDHFFPRGSGLRVLAYSLAEGEAFYKKVTEGLNDASEMEIRECPGIVNTGSVYVTSVDMKRFFGKYDVKTGERIRPKTESSAPDV